MSLVAVRYLHPLRIGTEPVKNMLTSLSKLSLLAVVTFQGAYAAQNQLQQVTGNIGPNPNNVGMFVYKPTKLASPTPLIVAIHYCSGTAQVSDEHLCGYVN